MYSYTYYCSPVGRLLLAGADGKLAGVWIEGPEILWTQRAGNNGF